MSSALDRPWPTAQDQVWADRALWRLVMHEGVSNDLAEEVLREAHQACREAQRPAVELFGEVDRFAAEVARERVPQAQRAAVDLDGTSPQDRWTVWFLALGWSMVPLSVVLLISTGWRLPVTAWGLAVLAAAVGLGTGVHWGLLERRAGRLRRGWAWWSAGAVALAGALTAGAPLQGRPALVVVSTLFVPLAGALLLAIGFLLPQRSSPARPQRQGPADASSQRWFEDLAGILRGRYLLRRREVARHVDEARSFFVDSGAAHPADEFGTAQEYALRLVDGSTGPRQGRARGRAWVYSAVAVFWCWVVGEQALNEGLGWGLAWRAAGLLLFASSAVYEWRHLRGLRAQQLHGEG